MFSVASELFFQVNKTFNYVFKYRFQIISIPQFFRHGVLQPNLYLLIAEVPVIKLIPEKIPEERITAPRP